MKNLIVILGLCWIVQAQAEAPYRGENITPSLQTSSRIEAAFSPGPAAEQLVLKVINDSRQHLRLAAYSFTSVKIVRALIKAKQRGVDVKVLVDEKGNQRPANLAALNLLVNAGIPTRTIASYAIHHDKYIVVDRCHVQTGSFNYSVAAAKSNSENVLVIWNQRDLAASYEAHWNSRWADAVSYTSAY